MKAHKVPATYCDGWQISGLHDRFYVFSLDDLHQDGKKLRYRDVKDKKFKPEHSYFIEENFYYIDWSIKGIAFKVKDEISDFLNNSGFSIKCVDDLAAVQTEETPYISIDNYERFISYQTHIDHWLVSSKSGDTVSVSDFKKALNDYLFNRVGKLIEENYFANYLENMWGDLKASIANDIVPLKSGEPVILSRKADILEFFVVQYLRCDKRINTDIKPVLDMCKQIFIDMQADKQTISELEDEILSPYAYFYGILLDAARGNKSLLLPIIDNFDRNFYVDVLQAPQNYSYVTSTFPCILSKEVDGAKEEMLFPVQNNLCLRFRRKHEQKDFGKYIVQTSSELKCINKAIASGIGDLIISEHPNISFLFDKET